MGVVGRLHDGADLAHSKLLKKIHLAGNSKKQGIALNGGFNNEVQRVILERQVDGMG